MVRHPRNPAADRKALHQADLSHLRLQDMTPTERAELKRRYEQFVRHFRGAGSATRTVAAKPKRIRKWTPRRKG